nr:hypothetical protein [Tanacetum cinerariifolium]
MFNATKDNFDEDDLVKFQELLLDAEKPLYEGCPDFTKLSAIVKLLNLKGKYEASDKFFAELLGLIKKMLHASNKMDDKDLTACQTYGISRWKVDNKTHIVYGNIPSKDPLVNYDNDNENDDLRYQSEEYFDEVQEDDENNQDIRKHRALFLSFLRDMVREHIGLKILSWKKVDSEARDKLLDEITRYFNVDLTVKMLVMNRLGQLLRNFRRNTKVKSAVAKMACSMSVYQHTMGLDEEPAYGTLWLKGRVNKDEEYPDDEIRSARDKLKETKDKIKEGTLKVDHGTDAMTVVLGKEKGGYARGVGSEVTYNSVDEEGRIKIHGCENDASIQKFNGLATLEKEMETRDCYKVSIDTSLVDAACIPDVRNNGFKTVKDAVVFDTRGFCFLHATPPSTVQMNVENKTAPKLQMKRKNVYVSSDAMQKQAKKKRGP